MKRLTYTPSSLNQELKRVIEGRYPNVLVEGEVSNLNASRHCYLTLRDADSQLNCVVWRNTWLGSAYKPTVGERVVVSGRLSVFPQRGQYQLYVNSLQPAGQGALARKIAEIKARLMADGLLEERRKRPLPRFPEHIGVVTSLTSAALQDFLKVSGERFPASKILVAGATVQGDTAAASVIMALELLIEDGRSEVIVITRGGGSKDDLVAFHDEQLARAIAASPVPVVSAVGHQIDVSISDLVADASAPTPSAAAALVTPDGPALSQRVDEGSMALERAVLRAVGLRRERVEGLRQRLRHPGERLKDLRRRRADLEARLGAALQRQVSERSRRVQVLEQRLLPSLRAQVQESKARLSRADAGLEALSPLAVLGRGYAIVQGANGVVLDPKQVAAGEELTLRVRDGQLSAVAIHGSTADTNQLNIWPQSRS